MDMTDSAQPASLVECVARRTVTNINKNNHLRNSRHSVKILSELLQDRLEKSGAGLSSPSLLLKGGRAGNKLLWRAIHVKADSDDQVFKLSVRTPPCLDENTADLFSSHKKVIRTLEGDRQAEALHKHLGHAPAGELGQPRGPGRLESGTEEDRKEEIFPPRGDPSSSPFPPPLSLKISDKDRSHRCPPLGPTEGKGLGGIDLFKTMDFEL